MKPHNKNPLRVVLLAAILASATPTLAFQDPTEVPALPSSRLLTSPMTAIGNADQRLVAVGQRGHIAYSDDQGKSWIQAPSPVSSDLVAVHFADAKHGWAVGHGGIVLHSANAGESWQLQLNGKTASTLINSFYASAQNQEHISDTDLYIQREEILESYGGTQPLMAVYFLDHQRGFVAGLFNRLLFTEDGGKTWQPWQHRIDNPNELHVYAFAKGPAGLYATGEQGKVWRLDEEQNYFVDVSTDYTGTLFGALVEDQALLVYGMRGSLFRTTDQGASWQRIETHTTAGISSARVLADKSIALSTLSGEIKISFDQGKTFTSTRLKESMPYYDMGATADGSLALVGARGLQRSEKVTALAQKATAPATVMLGDENGRQH